MCAIWCRSHCSPHRSWNPSAPGDKASASPPSVSRRRPVFRSSGTRNSGCWRIRTAARPSHSLFLSSDLLGPVDPGEGSSVKGASTRARSWHRISSEQRGMAANRRFIRIGRSLRCREVSESARPRANLALSPYCMRTLQTVWRSAVISNRQATLFAGPQ